MIDVACPQCHAVYHSEESHIGKQLRCARCGFHVQILRTDRAVVQQSPPSSAATRRKASPASPTPLPRRVQRIGKSAIVPVVVAAGAFSLAVLRHHIVAEHRAANLSDVMEPARPSQNGGNNDACGAVVAVPSVARSPQADISEHKPFAPDDLRPAHYNSLPTGTRIEEDIGTNGYGKLTVDNGTTEDAVVRLSGIADNTLRFFFVKARSSAHAAQIPGGVYRLKFTTGLNWAESEDTFSWHPSYNEFERTFEFNEQRDSEGVHYHSISVTLHPVAFGNIRTKAITREDFLRGHRHLALQRP